MGHLGILDCLIQKIQKKVNIPSSYIMFQCITLMNDKGKHLFILDTVWLYMRDLVPYSSSILETSILVGYSASLADLSV